MVWQPSSLTLQQKESRRLHFAKNTQFNGEPVSQMAEYDGISTSGIYYWKRRLKAGLDVLRSTKPTVRISPITDDQIEQPQNWSKQPAIEHGFPDPTWTVSRTRDLIGLTFGVWYHPNHVAKLLRFLGFFCQRSDKRATFRNEEKIATWMTTVPDIIQKVQQGITLFFLDEPENHLQVLGTQGQDTVDQNAHELGEALGDRCRDQHWKILSTYSPGVFQRTPCCQISPPQALHWRFKCGAVLGKTAPRMGPARWTIVAFTRPPRSRKWLSRIPD